MGALIYYRLEDGPQATVTNDRGPDHADVKRALVAGFKKACDGLARRLMTPNTTGTESNVNGGDQCRWPELPTTVYIRLQWLPVKSLVV